MRHLVPLAALVAGLSMQAAPADACSFGISTIWQSYPAREATGVPTNVVPIMYTDGSERDVLLRHADGTPVAVEVTREDPDGYVLRPLAELEPLSDYELAYGPARVPFTTGEGPAPVVDELGVPDFSATRVSYPLGLSCGRSEFVCGSTASAGLLFEARLGEDVMLSDRVLDPSQWLSLQSVFGSFQSPDECLDVYARDVRGRRSAPLTLCGDEVEVIEFAQVPSVYVGCDEAFAIADGGLPGYWESPVEYNTIEASGCALSPAVSPGARRQAGGAWAVVTALGLLAHRMRRRVRLTAAAASSAPRARPLPGDSRSRARRSS